MENKEDETLAKLNAVGVQLAVTWLSYLFIVVGIVMLGLIGRQLEELNGKVDALSSSVQAIQCERKEGCSLP